MEIRASRVVQGHNLAVDNGFGRKFSQRFSNVRILFVEILAVAGVQDGVAAGPHSDGTIAVQFYFVGPLRSFGKLGDRGAFHWFDNFGFSFWERFQASCSASSHALRLQCRTTESRA